MFKEKANAESRPLETEFVSQHRILNMISSQVLSSTSNIKKTTHFSVPQNYFQDQVTIILHYFDQEQMYIEIVQMKQYINFILEENKRLKTLLAQNRKHIAKIENVEDDQLNAQNILGLRCSGEGSIVPILKAKIRQQNEELFQLKDDLTSQHRSIKLTKTKELEQQLKKYQDEVIRLSYLLKNALKINDTDLDRDPDIQQKMIKQLEIIENQREEIKNLKQQNSNCSQELQKHQINVQKLEYQLQTISLEKQKLKKTLDEIMTLSNQNFLLKKRELLENKLEVYIKDCDVMKGQLTVKESQLYEIQKQYKELQKEFNTNNQEKAKQIQRLQETLDKREREIQELQERVHILDLLKQKNQQMRQMEQITAAKKLIPPITYREEWTQCPEVEEQLLSEGVIRGNTDPIDLKNLKWVLLKLRYKLIRLQISRDRVKQTLSNSKFVKIRDLNDLFHKFPFSLSKGEALSLSRFLIEEDKGKGYYVEMDELQEVNHVAHNLLEKIGVYQVRTIYEETKLLKRISSLWKKSAKQIGKWSNKQMDRNQFEDCMYNLFLNKEEMDFIFQLNYELSNLLKIVDVEKLTDFFSKILLDLSHHDESFSFREIDQFSYFKAQSQMPAILVQSVDKKNDQEQFINYSQSENQKSSKQDIAEENHQSQPRQNRLSIASQKRESLSLKDADRFEIPQQIMNIFKEQTSISQAKLSQNESKEIKNRNIDQSQNTKSRKLDIFSEPSNQENIKELLEIKEIPFSESLQIKSQVIIETQEKKEEDKMKVQEQQISNQVQNMEEIKQQEQDCISEQIQSDESEKRDQLEDQFIPHYKNIEQDKKLDNSEFFVPQNTGQIQTLENSEYYVPEKMYDGRNQTIKNSELFVPVMQNDGQKQTLENSEYYVQVVQDDGQKQIPENFEYFASEQNKVDQNNQIEDLGYLQKKVDQEKIINEQNNTSQQTQLQFQGFSQQDENQEQIQNDQIQYVSYKSEQIQNKVITQQTDIPKIIILPDLENKQSQFQSDQSVHGQNQVNELRILQNEQIFKAEGHIQQNLGNISQKQQEFSSSPDGFEFIENDDEEENKKNQNLKQYDQNKDNNLEISDL